MFRCERLHTDEEVSDDAPCAGVVRAVVEGYHATRIIELVVPGDELIGLRLRLVRRDCSKQVSPTYS